MTKDQFAGYLGHDSYAELLSESEVVATAGDSHWFLTRSNDQWAIWCDKKTEPGKVLSFKTKPEAMEWLLMFWERLEEEGVL